MTDYLSLEIVARQGAKRGLVLRDPGLLDAAIHRPQVTIFGEDAYPTKALKAAALLHSITQGQAFLDGNKRMAVLSAGAFVELNGHRITASEYELLAVEIPDGLHDIEIIAARLKVKPRG
jgi:death-on-curing protein